MTVVAIHQPNFFPWLGYFDKLARADRFVLLDDVQFPDTKAGNWGNRVQCLINGKPQWLTATLDRSFEGTRLFNAMQFHPNEPWRKKMERVLQPNYRKAPFYAEAMDLVQPLLANPDNRLADYNGSAIVAIAAALGLDTGKIVRSSDLQASGVATERNISLTKAAGGSVYLSGGGASGYQEEELFHAAGVTLSFQSFQHPSYPQVGSPDAFVPGMSIIDALMNCGIAGTRALLRV